MLHSMDDILGLMRALRDPDTGCLWDIKQTFASIAPYTIEEAYEVEDAILRKDYANLKEELSDLLLQVVFHSQMASEQNLFDFNEVVDALGHKMISRHPHVFADKKCDDVHAVKVVWEETKAKERASKVDASNMGLLADVPTNMPSLMGAYKLQKRASSVGFDWPYIEPVMAKVREELDELEQEIKHSNSQAQQEEFGDLMFAMVNLSRHLGFSAETALREANAKFIRRFHTVETKLKQQGIALENASLAQMEQAWQNIKAQEKSECDEKKSK